MTKEDAWKLAKDWVAAWNDHDLDRIMTHYERDIALISPIAAQLLQIEGGKIEGNEKLRAYFERGLKAYPDLHFSLEDVLCGVNSVVLCYKNQQGTHVAEFMELSPSGKVARVVANYGV